MKFTLKICPRWRNKGSFEVQARRNLSNYQLFATQFKGDFGEIECEYVYV